MFDYKLQLLGFGPFTLPKNDKWLIVGSGPSLDHIDDFDCSDYGIISLNSTQKIVPHSNISIFSHFESVIGCWNNLDRSDFIYIANPIHAGFRCIPLKAVDMFNNEDFIRYLPNKVRFFEKESSLNGFKVRSHTLFCEHTIASAALSLLSRNGIKEVWTIGIDGGEGHAVSLGDIREYSDDKLIPVNYEKAYKEFYDTAHVFGIKLHKLEESNAMLQAG